MLERRQVFQTQDYRSAFDLTVDGYTDSWWDSRSRVRDAHHDWFVFSEDGTEVARAEADAAARIESEYIDLTTPRDVVDVVFFEVRSGHRGRGVGHAAAALLVDEYRGRDLIAFSEEADGFWTSAGWTLYPRVDGSRLYRPLFLHHGTGGSR
ncbi:GNAT family N-acetyltransferase [Clavibacter michiganensis]|nr:GNAT family N-acetyltransferase [Clavibacter michiganensis]MDO4144099.1 hypothetical protein [Clavibacter michiganensis]QIT13015.1 hypothetical protein GRD74_15635 [Clavibacter michiganensis subsp. michiganensis]QIT16169.1 hypothetical protein GRD61_15775 [Clavibacter michiganensis subsp. michiganensis]